jgi:hypothetical protein
MEWSRSVGVRDTNKETTLEGGLMDCYNSLIK